MTAPFFFFCISPSMVHGNEQTGLILILRIALYKIPYILYPCIYLVSCIKITAVLTTMRPFICLPIGNIQYPWLSCFQPFQCFIMGKNIKALFLTPWLIRIFKQAVDDLFICSG